MATRRLNPREIRRELRGVLTQQREVLGEFLALAGDESATPAQLVDFVDLSEGLDDQRDALIERLREVASGERQREEEWSVRQFVLKALKEIGGPQKAGFLNEYVWAGDRVKLDTRGFGALARDEREAWRRHRKRRLEGDLRAGRDAYIVPALDAQGEPHPRWWTRSDWEPEQRVVLSRDDRCVELRKLSALFHVRQERDPSELYDPLGALIEKHASQLLEANDAPPAGEPDRREKWLDTVRRRTERELNKAERATRAERRAAAERIVALPEEQQLWGREAK
jgi:hypothetical protein